VSSVSVRRSRRHLLSASLALAAAAVAAPAAAAVPARLSQQAAHYQPMPKYGQSCAMCQLFRPPHACQVVAGDIAPQGWCKFFSLPD
jgi:anaerobic selenocysteine-containing dehydrogenase